VVTDADGKAAFLSVPELAGLYPLLAQAYERGKKVEYAETLATAVAAISATQKTVDVRHDCGYRALWYGLTARSQLLLALDPPDEAGAEAIVALRDRLLPEGLAGVKATYSAEEGHAQRMQEQVDAPTRTTLAETVLAPGHSALDVVGLIAGQAQRLGELDRDKAQAGTRSASIPDGRQVRTDLIQLLSLVSAVAAKSTAPKDVLNRIVGPIDEALARAMVGHPKAAAPAPASPGSSPTPSPLT
jgi:hypothetical protein